MQEKSIIRQEYFEYRMKMDTDIQNFKDIMKRKRKTLAKPIKNAAYVSLQKIDFYISLYKQCLPQDSLGELSEELFKDLINSFENDISQKYILHKDIICEYAEETLRAIQYFASYKNKKKRDLESYRFSLRKQINIYALENSYVEMKRNFKSVMLADNNSIQFLEELRENRIFADDFLLNEIKKYQDNKTSQEKALLCTVLGAVDKAQSELSTTEIPKIIEHKTPKESKSEKKVKTPKMTEADILKIIMGSPDLVKAIQES